MDLFSKDIKNIINKYKIQLSDNLFNVVCQIDGPSIIFHIGGKTQTVEEDYFNDDDSEYYELDLSKYIDGDVLGQSYTRCDPDRCKQELNVVSHKCFSNVYTLDEFLKINGFYFQYGEHSYRIIKLYKTDEIKKYCLFLKGILSQYK
jgi:hypothetical protein